VLEYKVDGSTLSYRWADVVPGFAMPIRVAPNGTDYVVLHPTTAWQTLPTPVTDASRLRVDENYYVVPRLVSPAPR
jgi:hypothetical protein